MKDKILLHSQDIAAALVTRLEGTEPKSESLVLYEDAHTGMRIKYLKYLKGNVTALHRHTCGHGFYVLSGTLYTDVGDYEAGSFVWFEKGCEMVHGAKYGDDECLMITDSTFAIEYL